MPDKLKHGGALALVLSVLQGTGGAACAQSVAPAISYGDATVSGFSGTSLPDGGLTPGVDPVDKTVIDLDGASLRTFDLTTPNGRSAGTADDQWIALTLSRKGGWGLAADASRARSISLAIRRCQQMTGPPNDCGSLLTAVQNTWSLAVLCGDYNIVATGNMLAEVEAAAWRREADLRALYAARLPPCVRIVTVDPTGRAAVGEPGGLTLPATARPAD